MTLATPCLEAVESQLHYPPGSGWINASSIVDPGELERARVSKVGVQRQDVGEIAGLRLPSERT